MKIYQSGDVSSDTLVVLHSMWLSHHLFDDFIDNFKDRFHVVAFDIYGHGASPSWGGEVLDLSLVARQVSHQLSSIGVNKFHLLGQSMGSDIALRIALESPDRVLSMALLGGGCRPAASDRLQGTFDWINQIDNHGFSESDRTKIVGILLGSSTLENPHKVSIVSYVRSELDRLSPDAVAAMRGVFSRTGLCSNLGTLSIPSLVISGTEDAARGVPLGEEMAGNLVNARFISFNECGHTPILEQSEKCYSALEDFWSTVNVGAL